MKKQLLLCLILLVTFSNCASIFTGSHRQVLLETNPEGASIYVNGKKRGETPKKIALSKNDKVNFRLDGFKEELVVIDSKFNLVSILNGLNVIGWGIDAITGSLNRVSTKYVRLTLTPEKDTAYLDILDKASVVSVTVDTATKTIKTTVQLFN